MKTTTMKFNLTTFSDAALQSIAAGKNPAMAERAREILASRKCPVVKGRGK